MRAPLSIVIPTLNAIDDLPEMLACLMEGVEAGLVRELVVSDGGSTDDTGMLARQAGALVVTGAPGRGGQLARGATAAQGNWLLFVHADTHLARGWAGAVLNHIETGSSKAGYFRLGFRASGPSARWVAGWANLRARAFGLPYGDQGLLIAREHYDSVGGYRDIALMEDVAMARALKGQLTPLAGLAETGASRYRRNGWFRGGARNLLTLARYFLGADPSDLARSYTRR